MSHGVWARTPWRGGGGPAPPPPPRGGTSRNMSVASTGWVSGFCYILSHTAEAGRAAPPPWAGRPATRPASVYPGPHSFPHFWPIIFFEGKDAKTVWKLWKSKFFKCQFDFITKTSGRPVCFVWLDHRPDTTRFRVNNVSNMYDNARLFWPHSSKSDCDLGSPLKPRLSSFCVRVPVAGVIVRAVAWIGSQCSSDPMQTERAAPQAPVEDCVGAVLWSRCCDPWLCETEWKTFRDQLEET